ncbi:MAG: endo-1,4-beta-xylanase [Bacteroidetes bacterium]|nr:MAG: endo-1,4-beta-xylanase [Bacteroidota bacterium]
MEKIQQRQSSGGAVRVAALLSLMVLFACKPEAPVGPEDKKIYTPVSTLRGEAPFPVGTAVQSGRIDQSSYANLINKEFSSITAEYEMKQDVIHMGPGSYEWGSSDAIVDFGVKNSIRVHGHALLWHSSAPAWFDTYSGDNAAFEQMMKTYIQTVVTRYKGKVASWDVVNEAFEDGSGAYRNTIYYQKMGPDYIAKCFQWAHEADPDALLFYNDYGAEYDNSKRKAIVEMIEDLKARGIPIHGFGFQMHINYNWPSLSELTKALDALKATGLKIHFSELDVRMNPANDLTSFTEARALAQEERYREIVTLYKTLPAEQQFGITLWGIKDNESWLLNFWGNPEWPLLFDSDFRYKIAHRGMVEGL